MNGEQIPARVIGSVERADVAALQLERVPDGMITAKIGDSDRV